MVANEAMSMQTITEMQILTVPSVWISYKWYPLPTSFLAIPSLEGIDNEANWICLWDLAIRCTTQWSPLECCYPVSATSTECYSLNALAFRMKGTDSNSIPATNGADRQDTHRTVLTLFCYQNIPIFQAICIILPTCLKLDLTSICFYYKNRNRQFYNPIRSSRFGTKKRLSPQSCIRASDETHM